MIFLSPFKVPGVFSKCLRNMWAITGFFNFFLCLLCFATLPADKIVLPNNQPNDQLLANMGQEAAGGWLSMLVRTSFPNMIFSIFSSFSLWTFLVIPFDPLSNQI